MDRPAGHGSARLVLLASRAARSRRFAPERELLATLALGGGFAAAALLPARSPAGADLWLTAAALGSGLTLLWLGLRFRRS
jgi:hypothetical protein